jgi:FlaA1/EpsC-like NDP-sugar epimerase
LRPGEKLYEELLSMKEEILPTHNEKIKIAKVTKSDYKIEVLKVIASLKGLYNLSEAEVIDLFEILVPEYKHSKNTSNGDYLIKEKSRVAEKSV